MIYVAWDIETCPIPIDDLNNQQRARYEKNLARQLRKNPDIEEWDASQKVRSLSPFLGWICCISLVSYRPSTEELGAGTSFAAERMTHKDTEPHTPCERDALHRFWKTVAKLPHDTRWVTFNGKSFDAPFLRTRTAAHGLEASRFDLLNTYPYKHHPHADLANVYRYVGLADVCDLLNIPSPKSDMDGSGVAEAVADGRIQEVIQYCERDARATMECYLASEPILP